MSAEKSAEVSFDCTDDNDNEEEVTEKKVTLAVGPYIEDDTSSQGVHSAVGGLTQEEVLQRAIINDRVTEDISDLFSSLDLYGNGFLTYSDVQVAFSTFGIEIDLDDCHTIIDGFDTNATGRISFGEFQREMRDIMLVGTCEEHLKMVFEAFDIDGDGYFGPEEVMRQFQIFGAFISLEEVMAAFNRMIVDDTGIVEFSTFKAYCDRKIGDPRIKGLSETDKTEKTEKPRKMSVQRKVSVAQRDKKTVGVRQPTSD